MFIEFIYIATLYVYSLLSVYVWQIADEYNICLFTNSSVYKQHTASI